MAALFDKAHRDIGGGAAKGGGEAGGIFDARAGGIGVKVHPGAADDEKVLS